MPEPREESVRQPVHSGHSRGMTAAVSGALSQLDRITYYYMFGGMSAGHSLDEIREVLAEVPGARDDDVLRRVAEEVDALPPEPPSPERVDFADPRWIEVNAPTVTHEVALTDAMDRIEVVLRKAGVLVMCAESPL